MICIENNWDYAFAQDSFLMHHNDARQHEHLKGRVSKTWHKAKQPRGNDCMEMIRGLWFKMQGKKWLEK
jgi:hypothetical protein